MKLCKICACRFAPGKRNWENLFSHALSPYCCHINISAGDLKVQKRVCLTWVGEWMWGIPLTQPEKYSCYALFCFHATTSSLWHLAVIRGKPWIPHISTVNSNFWIPILLPRSRTQQDCCTLLGQCPDSNCMHEVFSHFLSAASARLMTERLCFSLQQGEDAFSPSEFFFLWFSFPFVFYFFLRVALAWVLLAKLHQSSKAAYVSAECRMWHSADSHCLFINATSDVHCGGKQPRFLRLSIHLLRCAASPLSSYFTPVLNASL